MNELQTVERMRARVGDGLFEERNIGFNFLFCEDVPRSSRLSRLSDTHLANTVAFNYCLVENVIKMHLSTPEYLFG